MLANQTVQSVRFEPYTFPSTPQCALTMASPPVGSIYASGGIESLAQGLLVIVGGNGLPGGSYLVCVNMDVSNYVGGYFLAAGSSPLFVASVTAFSPVSVMSATSLPSIVLITGTALVQTGNATTIHDVRIEPAGQCSSGGSPTLGTIGALFWNSSATLQYSVLSVTLPSYIPPNVYVMCADMSAISGTPAYARVGLSQFLYVGEFFLW